MDIEMTKGRKIVILCSAIWLILILVISLSLAEEVVRRGRVDYESIDFVEFLGVFMILGVVPVLLLWGITWIRSTSTTNAQIEDFLKGVPLSPDINCPRCDAQMKLKTAKSGPHAGKVFWGCSRFPSCIQIAPLSVGPVNK